VHDGVLEPSWEDDVVRATVVARDGEIVHPQVGAQLEEVAVS